MQAKGTPTILVVEDEVDIASNLEMLFTMEGYAIRLAYNGIEALNVLKSATKIDIIITDIMMPIMNGYELMDAICENDLFKKIPLILTSAGYLDRTRLKPNCYQLFIPKPYNLDAIFDAVTSIIPLPN